MSSNPKRYSHSSAQTIEGFGAGGPHRLGRQDASGSSADHHVFGESELPYIETSTEDLLAPPDFRAFYTLIEDPESGEHHHPSVHYVFSDDNPDVITSAIIDTIEPEKQRDQERIVIVDIGPDGKTVTEVQSLSSDWQVSNVTIAQAPSFREEQQGGEPGGLMLKIDGAEAQRRRPLPDRRRSSLDGTLTRLEASIVGYGERLYALDKLVKKDILNHDTDEVQVLATEQSTTVDFAEP